MFGAGALVGALLAASLGRASWTVLLGAASGFGVAQLALAPEHNATAAAVLLFVAGALLHAVDVPRPTRPSSSRRPDQLRGRVIGLYFFAFNGAGPAGGVLAGWLAARGGTELAFAVSGASALAMAVAATVLRSRDTRGYASASLSEP